MTHRSPDPFAPPPIHVAEMRRAAAELGAKVVDNPPVGGKRSFTVVGDAEAVERLARRRTAELN